MDLCSRLSPPTSPKQRVSTAETRIRVYVHGSKMNLIPRDSAGEWPGVPSSGDARGSWLAETCGCNPFLVLLAMRLRMMNSRKLMAFATRRPEMVYGLRLVTGGEVKRYITTNRLPHAEQAITSSRLSC